jgi:hypothetical protein
VGGVLYLSWSIMVVPIGNGNGRSYPSATKGRSVVDLRRSSSNSSSSSSSSSIQATLSVNPQGSTHKWMEPLNSYSGRFLVSVQVEVSFWFTKTALSTGKVRYGR